MVCSFNVPYVNVFGEMRDNSADNILWVRLNLKFPGEIQVARPNCEARHMSYQYLHSLFALNLNDLSDLINS
jgi:hypothetical protein